MADNDLKAITVSENTTSNTSKWLGISDNIIVTHECECSLYRNRLQSRNKAHRLRMPNRLGESSAVPALAPRGSPEGRGFRLVCSEAPRDGGRIATSARAHPLSFLAFDSADTH